MQQWRHQYYGLVVTIGVGTGGAGGGLLTFEGGVLLVPNY